MRIALVCPYDMIGHAGGVQQIVMHQAEGLRKAGHKVKIITPRPLRSQHEAPKDFIFIGNSTKFRAGLATTGDVGYEPYGKEIEAVLAREKFDVIHFHEPWMPVLSRQIINRADCALVGTLHANLSDSAAGRSLVNLFTPYGRPILEKLDVITAVSMAAAKSLIRKVPTNDPIVTNMRFVPNGIDLKKYQTVPRSVVKNPNVKTIFYVGRLEGRKGLKYLLKAYSDLVERRNDVQLFIAGKGVDEEKLRDYVKNNKIPNVTFLGYITDEEKIYHLHRADVFCAPAHRGESFGIVLVEAMAAGCPIVAGDNDGYASVMKGTGMISLVNPMDTIDFSRRLEIMLYDEPIRNLWKKWAASYVKSFDWGPIIRTYESIYKDAIKIHAKKTAAKS